MKKTMTVNAKVEKLREVVSFLEEILEEQECAMKNQMQVSVAAEEIFVNIASYAYPEKEGEALIEAEIGQAGNLMTDQVKMEELNINSTDPVISVTFTDSGVAYDPLAKPDPDVGLPVEERGIGGLGIFMVKKSMDEVRYERRGDQNIFTMVKRLR